VAYYAWRISWCNSDYLDPKTGLSTTKLQCTKHVKQLNWWLLILMAAGWDQSDANILALAAGYTQPTLVGCMVDGVAAKVAKKMESFLSHKSTKLLKG
jgi:hypothetical protein